MSFKTILSVVGVEQSDSDIKQAMELCRENSAHLAVMVLALAAPPPIGEYGAAVSDIWAEERERDMGILSERATAIRQLVAKEGISAEVNPVYCEQASADDVVGLRARYADLALIGPELGATHTLKKLVLDGLFFAAQKPALIVPEGATPSLAPKTVVIAWDSGLEASRAVSEALPLIGVAEDVHIVMVDPQAGDDGNGAEPGADLAAYLAHHGAKATIDRLPSSGHTIAEVIARHARDNDADLLVMGAFGHSRLRERIFGGVTHSLTSEPSLPTFIAR